MVRFVQVFGEKARLTYGYFRQQEFSIFSLVVMEFYYSEQLSVAGVGLCLPYLYSAGILFKI